MTAEYALSLIGDIATHQISTHEPIEAVLQDSLDIIWGVQQIEQRAGIAIPNEAVLKFRTVGDMVDYLVAHT